MSNARQILANRANAVHSTGPTTEEGKQAVSQNAVRHGLLSKGPLIPGEDPAEYQQYRDKLISDLDPQGDLELLLADRIVGCFWKLRRTGLLEAALLRFIQKEYGGIDGRQNKHTLRVSENEIPDSDAGENTNEKLSLMLATHAEDMYYRNTMGHLQRYEVQIDAMLYRTLNQLQRLQFLRSQGSSVPSVVGSVLGQQTKVPDQTNPSNP